MSSELPPDLLPIKLQHMEPRFEYAFQTRVLTGYVHAMEYGAGRRLMVSCEGGDIDGPKLKGRILPGGNEWPTYRPDGVAMVDARYTFETHDGVFINIRNVGYRWGPPGVIERVNALEEFVDPETYYMRTTPIFEAPPGPYEWLARHCFVGLGERQKECLFMRYYMVL